MTIQKYNFLTLHFHNKIYNLEKDFIPLIMHTDFCYVEYLFINKSQPFPFLFFKAT